MPCRLLKNNEESSLHELLIQLSYDMPRIEIKYTVSLQHIVINTNAG